MIDLRNMSAEDAELLRRVLEETIRQSDEEIAEAAKLADNED